MLSAQSPTDASLCNSKKQFDTIIVFGQGPIKPVFLQEELASTSLQNWNKYKHHPLRYKEPGFFVMESSKELSKLQKIVERKDISEGDKKLLKIQKMVEWQHTGWYALKTMGRQNALAAGYALYTGMADEVILSGGRTISNWAKKQLSEHRRVNWPSEAELMKDIILRYYSTLYQKKYNRSIEEVVILEDASTNTLENFAYSINRKPELLLKRTKIGFISAGHHLKRIGMLAKLFTLSGDKSSHLSCQDILRKAAESASVSPSVIVDEKNSYDARQQYHNEQRWIKALEDPEYITYWVGYVALVNNPTVIKSAFELLRQRQWISYIKEAFEQVGIEIGEYQKSDIEELARKSPEKYLFLVKALRKFKSGEYRKLPPPVFFEI